MAFIFLGILTGIVGFAGESTNTPLKFRYKSGGLSGSMTIELRNSVLFYSADHLAKKTETATITPTPAQWEEFRATLDRLSIWQWQTNYANPFGVTDGGYWDLEITYADHSLKSFGVNNYPKAGGEPNGKPEYTREFDEYLKAVKKLLGGKLIE